MKANSVPPYLAPGDRVILFDGVCKLCNGWSRFIIRFDQRHHFKLASVQSPQGQALLQYFELPTERFDSMYYIEVDDGASHCFEKSDAFLEIVVQLGLPWKLLAVFGWIPRRLRDACYDQIAINRYVLFGRYNQYDACLLPTADHDSRFLGD